MDTKILILSDTHNLEPNLDMEKAGPIDILIHCGDFTESSTLFEMKQAVAYLESLPATLKLIIPGNHEITLDDDAFTKHLRASGAGESEVSEAYVLRDEARALFVGSKLNLLDEGYHKFTLPTGAIFTAYASPWTPRKSDEGALSVDEGGWGFQHELHEGAVGGREFKIPLNIDIAITHGPPRGVLDFAGGKRAGCPDLFDAVAKSQPKLHCFGHIHSSWGARNVAWRPREHLSQHPTHFDAIDNGNSTTIQSLRGLKADQLESGTTASFCEADISASSSAGRTLFVNASVEGDEDMPLHPAWVITMKLPTDIE